MVLTDDKPILVVEDELGIRDAICKILQKEGFKVLTAKDGKEGINLLQKHGAALVITDLKMPVVDGFELLEITKQIAPEVKVILISGHGTIEIVKQLMKSGAYDFIQKPSPDPGEGKIFRLTVLKTVRKALEDQLKDQKIAELEKFREAVSASEKVIVRSAAMRKIMDVVAQVAPSSATVLITGESGVGKEVIAQAIHEQSLRQNKPFIKVSCAALPETLLEAELFGYERGAFTGAIARREGRFEMAHGGTLFLDEVGDTNPSIQVKLLRVLQSGEFERLGGGKTIKSDVRLIAATNITLKEAVEQKKFREDLYYRLNVINIHIPPIRERIEDIEFLAHHFLDMFCKKNNKRIDGFSQELMDTLIKYNWPGNVRELENTVERAVVLTRGDQLTILDIPEEIIKTTQENPVVSMAERTLSIPIGTPLKEIERMVMEATLKKFKDDKNIASKILGISTRTIYRRFDKNKENKEDGE